MFISLSSSVMVFFVPFKRTYWVSLLELFLVRSRMLFVEEKALAVIKSKDSGLKDYHNFLIEGKRYTDHNAKRALSRKIAKVVYAVLNKGKRYNDKMIRK